MSQFQNSNYLKDDDGLQLYDDTPDSRISLEDIQKLENYFKDLDNFQKEYSYYSPETDYNTNNHHYGNSLSEIDADILNKGML